MDRRLQSMPVHPAARFYREPFGSFPLLAELLGSKVTSLSVIVNGRVTIQSLLSICK